MGIGSTDRMPVVVEKKDPCTETIARLLAKVEAPMSAESY